MIKAGGTGPDGRPCLLLGLSHRNLDLLRKDRPIKFDGKPYGYDGEIMIFAGETEQSMADMLTGMFPGLVAQDDPNPT